MNKEDFFASQSGFSSPQKDCPHIQRQNVKNLFEFFLANKSSLVISKCADCENQGENWITFEKIRVGCSRYVNAHMANYMTTSPPEDRIAFSLSDGSVWCYDCDSYITTRDIDLLMMLYGSIKFPDDKDEYIQQKLRKANFDQQPDTPSPLPLKKEEQQLDTALPNSNPPINFTYDEFVEGMQAKKYQKILFLVGAGISVSAGIPDFRTPGSGLYSQLESYQLPYPEAIFQILYFKQNPQPFYTLSKSMLDAQSHPVASHFFINQINQSGSLLSCFTQNIDGLELQAGLPLDKLIQAHGHFRTAHCVSCLDEAPIEEIMETIFKDEIPFCKTCDQGMVKPDIIFFGEKLGDAFFKEQEQLLQNADLIIVMGTSLQVYPFAGLVKQIQPNIPIVLINRENPGIRQENSLFIAGDIDTNLQTLCEKLGINLPKLEKVEVQKIDFSNNQTN